MATHKTTVTNGVSMGYVHTVTAQDVSDGQVILDFQTPYMLAAVIMVTAPSSVDPNVTSPVETIDAEISYPANGQVKIANGDSLFSLVADQLIHAVAQRRSSAS